MATARAMDTAFGVEDSKINFPTKIASETRAKVGDSAYQYGRKVPVLGEDEVQAHPGDLHLRAR